MPPTITAFARSPDRGRGLARDFRVRWALEEAGQPYEVRLLSFEEMAAPEHLVLQPFGQIPTWEEGDLVLFESGAIVLHVAGRHGVLLPADAEGRARAVGWMFAALNTIEPPIVEAGMVRLFERDQPWFEARLEGAQARAHARLGQLAARLGEGPWLDGDFSAGDLLMITVLMRAEAGGLLPAWPNLEAYLARGRAREAFERAFAAQKAVFEASGA